MSFDDLQSAIPVILEQVMEHLDVPEINEIAESISESISLDDVLDFVLDQLADNVPEGSAAMGQLPEFLDASADGSEGRPRNE